MWFILNEIDLGKNRKLFYITNEKFILDLSYWQNEEIFNILYIGRLFIGSKVIFLSEKVLGKQ